MLKKWICLMLALALCCAPLSMAVSEELEIDGEIELEELPDELDGDLALVPEDIVLEAEEPQPVEESEAAEPENIETDAVDEGFAPTYRRVRSDDTPVYADAASDAVIALLGGNGAVLAVEEKGARLRVAFDSEQGVVTGYVDAAALEALDEAGLKAQLAEGVTCYMGDPDLPLPTPACAFAESAAQAEATDPTLAEGNAVPGEEAQEGEAVANDGTAEDEGPSLTLSASKLTIGVKEKCKILTATLGTANSGDTVTWSSSKKSVAKVDKKTGVITGVKAGTATITAKAGSLKKTCKVTVAKAPSKVTLDVKKLTISVGQTRALKATLPSKTGSTLSFSSNNKDVATVDKYTGLVTAVAVGSATITVKTFNKKTATCKLTVVEVPDQVFLPETFTVAEKEHKTIEASVVGVNDAPSAAAYTYSAQDGTGQVTVDPATGEVVGVKAGTATITVTTHNDVSTHLSGGERVQTVCKVTVTPGPAEVSLAAKSATIGVGQKLDLSPVFLTSDGQEMEGGVAFTTSTSDKKKATVSSKGVVKGVKKGSATIKVKAFNGVKASCKVKVVKAPSKVSLSASKSVIGVGETTKVKPSFPSGTMASCTYSSSDTSVATVDEEGHVTGLSEGSAVIKVRTHNSKTAKVTVKVLRNPNIVTLNGHYDTVYEDASGGYVGVFTKTLKPDATFQIECQSEYGILGETYSYHSGDEDVATVTSGGLVTAVAPGTANIAVLSSTGALSILRVTVSGTVTGKLAFTASEAAVKVGRTVTAPGLKGTNMTAAALAAAVYESGDKGVFTVAWDEDEDRWLLTGVKAGTAKLTATAGGATAQLDVTVSDAAQSASIHFEDDRVYMAAGERFTPRVLDDSDAAVTAALTSGDLAVASVDEHGVVTAVGEGTAVITATVGSLTAQLTVVVQGKAAQVTLNAENLELTTGERFTLKAKVNGDGASSKLTWATSDGKVATVTASGVVIARGAGEAVITATEAGGAFASCTVVVGAAPTALNVLPTSVSQRLKTGGVQLSWSFGDAGEVGTVTFASSNEKVATVDEAGYVTFVAVGNAKITAETNNGIAVTVPVTVLSNQDDANKTTYRLFAAYSYYDSLPFTKRNASTVADVFERSNIGGQTYTTKVMGNPAKSSLLNGITSFFADTDDNDVSIVYLCSHGHDTTSSYSNYYMSLKGFDKSKPDSDYYMTSKEIFSRIKKIRGSVVLIIDSCYSGAFIEDQKSNLDAEGGRIAVLTAASNTKATYYNKKANSVDFFTFFLLQGLGYNERDGWWNKNAKAKKGSYPGYLAADKNGDGNGFVTLNEFYQYGRNCIDANIKSYMKKSWYWGDKKKVQKTRFYAGNLKNLVIYQAG